MEIDNIKIIKKNRSYIFNLLGFKIYYTIGLEIKLQKKDGYFIILYKIVNKLSVPLVYGDVDYILIILIDGLYLIPCESIPLNKRGMRIYDFML